LTSLTLYRHQIIRITGWVMRVSVLVGVLCFILVSVGNADPASAAIRQSTNIPAEPLDLALKTLAKERQFQVLFRAEAVRDLRTGGAVGEFTAEEALTKVLSGTGLSYKYLDAQTVTVFATAASAGVNAAAGQDQTNTTQDNSKEAGKKSSQDFPVAQVDQGQTPGPSTVEKQDEQASKKRKSDQLQEVVVTGSRIPTAAGQQPIPVLTYNREAIESSGQNSIGAFLSTVPDVSTFTPSWYQPIIGSETVQLHGLPVGTTLSLLDGRRLDENFYGYFDLSNIPMAAVERIEILPVGASAIYGADALGGAINIILRKDFNGLELNATLDRAPDVSNPAANLAWGKSWDRGSVSLVGTYQEIGDLVGTQREPTSRTSLPPNLSPLEVSTLANYSCAPGNVYSVNGGNLPGLSSPEAAIPSGITGSPTIGQFIPTAGKQNLCNSYNLIDLVPHTQREGALLSGHYQVTDSMDVFTEVLASHQTVNAVFDPQILVSALYDGTVAANNPYNPFGEAVNVSFEYRGAGQYFDQTMNMVRPMLGLRGSLFSDWHYEVTAYFSRDELQSAEQQSNSQLVSNALASSNPATALNPFTTGAPGSPALLASLSPASDISHTDLVDRTVSTQGLLRGPVAELPAGALQAVVGAEYATVHQDSTFTGFPPILLHRDTYAAFAESRVPLLADRSSGKERLALTLAGRYDHSSDYGGKATYQGGLLWRASESLSFSGSYGQSYQAPQLAQVAGPSAASPTTLGIPDPFRGNQPISYPVNFVAGSNPNLRPETGNSLTFGLQFSSQHVPGLHASATWYDLNISNYIGMEQIPNLIDYPNLFPGAVVRGPPTAQDMQNGFLGVITQINDIYYNFGDLHVAGVDAEIHYVIDTSVGQFTPSLSAANVYRWQSALLPGTPEMDAVSQATLNGVGWSPRWKGTAALAWKEGPLSLNFAGRYVGRYLDYQDFVANDNEIGNYWISDFNARYELGKALTSISPQLGGMYVAVGAVNLFNKGPQFSYVPSWYDLEQYDVRGRYFRLSFGARF
jgi:iron complex outermembrane receptor protein